MRSSSRNVTQGVTTASRGDGKLSGAINFEARGLVILAALVIAVALIGPAGAATYTWVGGDGNWSATSNWSVGGSTPATLPGQNDDIIIPNTASNRVITLDATPGGYGAAYWRYRSLAIAQTTAGVTQTIDFANHLRMDSSEYQQGTTFNVTAGNVVMNTGSYNWEWNSLNSGGSRTFPAGVTINATGGSKMNMRSWHNSPSALIQGPVTVSSGTVTAFEGSSTTSVKTTFDTASTLTINSNGILNSINTIELKGTLAGDGTGGIRPRSTNGLAGGLTEFFPGTSLTNQLKFMSGTIQVDNGAYFNGTVYLNSDNFDYRSNSASTDLRNVTIAPNSGGGSYHGTGLPGGGGANPYNDGNGYTAPSLVEVTVNDDANLAWGIGTLTMKRLNANGTTWSDRGALMLTDRYDNDPSSTAKEFLLVNNVGSGTYENLYLSDAIQGYDIHVNGGVGNWQKLAGVHVDTANAQSTIKFLTPSGGLNLAQNTYVSNGATLTIDGPATVSLDWLKFTNGGTFDFNGTIFTAAYNWTGGTATVNAHGNTVYGNAEAVGVSGAGSGPTLVIGGNLQTAGAIKAAGTSKTWSGGAPVVTPTGSVQIQGNYRTEVWNNPGEHITGQFNLGRQATISVTGNFTQRQFNSGNIGDSLINNWSVDTSPDAGTLAFNGGGSVTQTWETMSSAATTFTGLNFYSPSATPVAGTTVTGGTSGAIGTVSKVFGDLLKVTGVTGTFQADELLTFGDGKTARADAAQSVRPDLTNTAYPYGTVTIGDGVTNASVQLVNNESNRRYQALSTSPAQVVRNLTVLPGSTLDLHELDMIVSCGTATVAGSIIDSEKAVNWAGSDGKGSLILQDGAGLSLTGGNVAIRDLQIATGSGVTLSGGATINSTGFSLAGNNTIINTGGSNSIQGAMTLNGAVTINPQGGTLTISAPIDGIGSLNMTPGSGTVILSNANNTYGGATQVSSGRLHVTGTLAAGGTVTVDAAGVLSGSGTINRTVIIQNGGAIAPGASPGTLTTGAETWGPAGIYDWQLHNTTGTAGDPNGWDLLNIDGALTVTATSGNPFVIRLESLSAIAPDDVQGLALNWDPNATWSWLIAQAGDDGIAGWDVADGLESARFAVDIANFAGLLPKSAFFVSKTGNDVFLNHYLIPEPTSALLLGLAGLLALRRRRGGA